MKIRCFSDCHLDWYANALHQTRTFDPNEEPFDPFWYPPEMEDDKNTILILAGDIWVGTRFIEYAGYSWIAKVSQQFKQVLIVLGNHEFWPGNNSLAIVGGADKCNGMLQDHGLFNVHVLDCVSKEIDGVLFIGATLWTDMNKRDPLAMLNMTQFMAYDGKSRYKDDMKFSSERWVTTHSKHRKYIEQALRLNKDKKTVVITHHLPMTTLGDPRYDGDESNCYYSSDLSDVIFDNPQIALWCFGHSHHTVDRMMVNTRLVNQSVGYISEHKLQTGEFDEYKVIEL